MVSALDFQSGGRWFEPSLCRHVVSLDKKLYFRWSIFTQVYKWVLAIILLEVPLRSTSIPSRGEVAIFLVASCYKTGVKHQPDGPPDSYADFTPFLQNILHSNLIWKQWRGATIWIFSTIPLHSPACHTIAT